MFTSRDNENRGDVIQNYQNFCIIENESFEQRLPITLDNFGGLVLKYHF